MGYSPICPASPIWRGGATERMKRSPRRRRTPDLLRRSAPIRSVAAYGPTASPLRGNRRGMPTRGRGSTRCVIEVQTYGVKNALSGNETDLTKKRLQYRQPMSVTTLRLYHNQRKSAAYPICPRCKSALECEFQAYCDRRGQNLSWREYGKKSPIETT